MALYPPSGHLLIFFIGAILPEASRGYGQLQARKLHGSWSQVQTIDYYKNLSRAINTTKFNSVLSDKSLTIQHILPGMLGKEHWPSQFDWGHIVSEGNHLLLRKAPCLLLAGSFMGLPGDLVHIDTIILILIPFRQNILWFGGLLCCLQSCVWSWRLAKWYRSTPMDTSWQAFSLLWSERVIMWIWLQFLRSTRWGWWITFPSSALLGSIYNTFWQLILQSQTEKQRLDLLLCCMLCPFCYQLLSRTSLVRRMFLLQKGQGSLWLLQNLKNCKFPVN